MANNENMPGVYSGLQKLVSYKKLYDILTGPNEQIGESGYIPWKFKSDGSIDFDALFPQTAEKINACSGLTIKHNDITLLSGVNQLNFTGNYVYPKINDGKITIDIRKPTSQISRFNTTDGITDARVVFQNTIIPSAIMPGGNYLIYGDWIAGSKHPAINDNSECSGYVILKTNQKTFTNIKTSIFKVNVYDWNNAKLFEYQSNAIYSTLPDFQLLPVSQYISIKINQFKTQDIGCYSFIPTFNINLKKILQDQDITVAKRCKIQIIHLQNENQYEFTSEDFLYNIGKIPEISDNISLAEQDTSKTKFIYCSGLKYLISGNLVLSVGSISNLNYYAAVEKDELVDFNIPSSNILSTYINGYSSTTLDTFPSGKCTLKFNENIFNNKSIQSNITANNVFNSYSKNFSINVLINSMQIKNQSNEFSQFFNDEEFRATCNFSRITTTQGNQLEKWQSESLLSSNELMVIPSVGLFYPFGNWESFITFDSRLLPDYSNITIPSWRFFARQFGKTTDKIKFGGIFKFVGISKQEFLSDNTICIFRNENNNIWFSLKHLRGFEGSVNSQAISGILTKIQEINNELFVYWSYPQGYQSKKLLQFKFGIKQPVNYIIKQISLFNVNNEKEW